MPSTDGRIVPAGGARNVSVGFTMNVNGGDPSAIETRLRQFVRFELPGAVRKAVNDPLAVG